MITDKLQKAINEQITAELWSSNLYLSMTFFLARKGYPGMACWMKRQADEERNHACKMANYMISRGGVVKLDKLDVVPNDFGTPLEIFKQVYDHECRVSKMIDMLVDVASAEKDHATQDFLWGFVREQVEEEAIASNIVHMLSHADSANVCLMDELFGKRV